MGQIPRLVVDFEQVQAGNWKGHPAELGLVDIGVYALAVCRGEQDKARCERITTACPGGNARSNFGGLTKEEVEIGRLVGLGPTKKKGGAGTIVHADNAGSREGLQYMSKLRLSNDVAARGGRVQG